MYHTSDKLYEALALRKDLRPLSSLPALRFYDSITPGKEEKDDDDQQQGVQTNYSDECTVARGIFLEEIFYMVAKSYH